MSLQGQAPDLSRRDAAAAAGRAAGTSRALPVPPRSRRSLMLLAGAKGSSRAAAESPGSGPEAAAAPRTAGVLRIPPGSAPLRPRHRSDTDLLERARAAARMPRGLEHLSQQDRLGESGLISLEKREL